MESGSEFAGQIVRDRMVKEEQVESRRRYDKEQDQQDRFQRENSDLRQRELTMRQEAHSLNKRRFEQENEFKVAEETYRVQKRDNAARQRKALIELESKANEMMRNPASAETGNAMLDLWQSNLDLTNAEDELVREHATTLRERMTKFWESSNAFATMKKQFEAQAAGYTKDKEGVASKERDDLKTYAEGKGVDIESEIEPEYVAGRYETGAEGIKPENKARLKHEIDQAAARKAGGGKFSLGFGGEDEGKPTSRYTFTGDPAKDAIARTILEKQGVYLDENGQPTKTPTIKGKAEFDKLPSGTTFIWTDGKQYTKP
jgi:hypothetical protein